MLLHGPASNNHLASHNGLGIAQRRLEALNCSVATMARLTIPSILITDDDLTFRDTVRQALEPFGYRLSMASDGEEALRILQNDDVHLLLLDMHMPKLTGIETVKRARALKAPVPWILMSARVDDDLLEQARRADAFTVLNKPTSRLAITNNVELALRQSYNWSPLSERRIRFE